MVKIFERTDPTGLVTTAVFRERAPIAAGHHKDMAIEVDDDMVAIGGGATGSNHPGAMLYASYPNSDRTAWLVSSKDHRVATPHRLIGFAVGLKFNSTAMPRPRLLSNLSFTRARSDPAGHPQAISAVPSTYELIGGGFRVNWQESSEVGNFATASYPLVGGQADRWVARSKDHIDPSPCTIDAFAVGIRKRLVIDQNPSAPPNFRVDRRLREVTSQPARHPAADHIFAGEWALTGIGAEVSDTYPGNMLWKLEPTYDTDRPGVTASGKDHDWESVATIRASVLGIKLTFPA